MRNLEQRPRGLAWRAQLIRIRELADALARAQLVRKGLQIRGIDLEGCWQKFRRTGRDVATLQNAKQRLEVGILTI